jgi:hypothetical protein
MDRLTKWMDLLGMKFKHKMFILSWLGNFANGDPFVTCMDHLLKTLRSDKEPDPNILNLIDQIVALRVIDIARKGLDYEEDVARWKRQLSQ